MMKWGKQGFVERVIKKIEEGVVRENGEDPKFTGFRFQTYQALLVSNLTGWEGASPIDKAHCVQNALGDAVGKGPLTAQSVLKHVKRRAGDFHRFSVRPFVLATSVSIVRAASVPTFRINGCTITFGRDYPQRFSEEVQDLIEGQWQLPNATPRDDFVRTRIAVKERSPWAAVERALGALDFLRGLFNLHRNLSTDFLIPTQSLNPINRFLLGPFHTLHEPTGKRAVENFWFQPDYLEHKWRPYDPTNHFEASLVFVKAARKAISDCRFGEEIEDWVVKYCRALDEASDENAFMKLWALLERLTLLGKGDAYSVLAKRASFVFQEAGYYQKLLESFGEIRNRQVHDSENLNKESEAILHQLRKIVEQMLVFHVFRGRRFEELDEVRQFLSQPADPDKLKTKKKVVLSALEYRTE